jgi:hypothetical protein
MTCTAIYAEINTKTEIDEAFTPGDAMYRTGGQFPLVLDTHPERQQA